MTINKWHIQFKDLLFYGDRFKIMYQARGLEYYPEDLNSFIGHEVGIDRELQKLFIKYCIEQYKILGIGVTSDEVRYWDIIDLFEKKLPSFLKSIDLVLEKEQIEFPLSFKPKLKSSIYGEIFEELADLQIVDDNKTSYQETQELLTCLNVSNCNYKIYFIANNYVVSYLFEEHLFKLFYNLTRKTVEESKSFIQLKSHKGQPVFLKAKALNNAKSDRKTKDKEPPLELRQKIDKIFDSF